MHEKRNALGEIKVENEGRFGAVLRVVLKVVLEVVFGTFRRLLSVTQTEFQFLATCRWLLLDRLSYNLSNTFIANLCLPQHRHTYSTCSVWEGIVKKGNVEIQFSSLDWRLLSIVSSEINMFNSDSPLFTLSEIDMRKTAKTGARFLLWMSLIICFAPPRPPLGWAWRLCFAVYSLHPGSCPPPLQGVGGSEFHHPPEALM